MTDFERHPFFFSLFVLKLSAILAVVGIILWVFSIRGYDGFLFLGALCASIAVPSAIGSCFKVIPHDSDRWMYVWMGTGAVGGFLAFALPIASMFSDWIWDRKIYCVVLAGMLMAVAILVRSMTKEPWEEASSVPSELAE